jgi:osmotically-inducible protein OsmY
LLIKPNHILDIKKGHERMKSTVSSPIASSFADLALTTRVRGALHSDPRTRHSAIEVKCVDGTVTLSGEVPQAETALYAQQIALAVGGVDLVNTDIKWAQEPLIKV